MLCEQLDTNVNMDGMRTASFNVDVTQPDIAGRAVISAGYPQDSGKKGKSRTKKSKSRKPSKTKKPSKSRKSSKTKRKSSLKKLVPFDYTFVGGGNCGRTHHGGKKSKSKKSKKSKKCGKGKGNWVWCVQQAKKNLGLPLNTFLPAKKGTPLYKEAKKLHNLHKK